MKFVNHVLPLPWSHISHRPSHSLTGQTAHLISSYIELGVNKGSSGILALEKSYPMTD